MNSKIFSYVVEKLHETWHLPKHADIRQQIGHDTDLSLLPWTPGRREKFIRQLQDTFGVDIDLSGTVADLTANIDQQYLNWFFGEVWRPRTENYTWTGFRIADEIVRMNPTRVLDVGCGYNPFKERIPGLIGIDPYNDSADYMVDILDYNVDDTYDHIIALGSINFNSREDIESRFAKTVDLLSPGGHLWMRCNPGIVHKNGPWVEIFPWSFEIAYEFAKNYNLELKTLKQDQDRLFLLFVKK